MVYFYFLSKMLYIYYICVCNTYVIHICIYTHKYYKSIFKLMIVINIQVFMLKFKKENTKENIYTYKELLGK